MGVCCTSTMLSVDLVCVGDGGIICDAERIVPHRSCNMSMSSLVNALRGMGTSRAAAAACT